MNKVLRDIARQYAPALAYYGIVAFVALLLVLIGRL
jgi:hypothetical protein